MKALEYEAYGATGQDADHLPVTNTPVAPADTPVTPVAPKQVV